MTDVIMIDISDSDTQEFNKENVVIDVEENRDPVVVGSQKEITNVQSPLRDSNTAPSQHTQQTTPAKTPKQIQKEQEKAAREKQRERERIEREKAKEAERLLKEEKRLQREEEKRKREEEKERQKKELEFKREQLRKEKEQREKKKLQEKLKKEEERLAEKAKKEEERLAEKQRKEDEKRMAEEAKKKAEEEKARQSNKLKISNFFKPKTTVKSVVVTPEVKDNDGISDFAKTFQPFYLREGTTLFSFNRLEGERLKTSINNFDTAMKNNFKATDDLKSWLKSQSPQSTETHFVQEASYIYENQLDGTPMDIKVIKFYENVRSWIGTYTKPIDKSLAINPFKKADEVFIDWDDEADENEEGEGEEISDNEEEEEEDDEEDDFDDFLEDDNNVSTNRKIIGPLTPVVSWKGKDEQCYKIEILKARVSFPINPVNNYWQTSDSPKKNQLDTESSTASGESPVKKPKTLITKREDLDKFLSEVNNSDYTVPTMVEILKKHLPGYTKMTIENTLRHLAKKVGPKITERKWEVDTELLTKLSVE